MTISGDYPSPVMVNGYPCRNCSDVAKAQHDVDPADPQGSKKAVADDREQVPDKRHFAPEARDRDMLADMHRQEAMRVRESSASAAIAAYGAQPAAPGQFVSLTG